MILLDSLYINNSGGKMLLDYLVRELEESGINVFYLFDERCKDDYLNIPEERKLYLKASLITRQKFYKQHQHKFGKILCFGNLAPPLKLSIPVYTYFHQRIFLSVPQSFSLKRRLIFKLKSFLFKYLLPNTNLILLQTESIKEEFLNTIPSFKKENIRVLPFYEPLIYPKVEKKKHTFLYISSGSIHKNHQILIESFVEFYKECQKGELILTIDESHTDLFNLIKKHQDEGIPILNLGLVKKDELATYYAQSEFLIYPSLSESFGLGIVEALEADCKIIGADLPYMHTICEPTLTFDPNEKADIIDCFKLAVSKELKSSKQKTSNEINELIDLLKE